MNTRKDRLAGLRKIVKVRVMINFQDKESSVVLGLIATIANLSLTAKLVNQKLLSNKL